MINVIAILMTFARLILFVALSLLLSATGAQANELAPDRLTVMLGAAVLPDYDGSNDYLTLPATAAFVRVRGHSIALRGTNLSVNLVPERRNQRFHWDAGPLFNLRLDRSETPRDPVVALLRKRKVAAEGGGFIGFTKTGVLTSPYDSLSIRVQAVFDLGNVHRGAVVSAGFDYLMPVSTKSVLGLSGSVDFTDGRYARYYFGIGPRASAASRVPEFRPKPGWKGSTLTLLAGTALKGDLRQGLMLGAAVSYSRLRGDYAASPLVATRGNRNQIALTAGLAYTF